MDNLKFITPLLDELDHCLSIGEAPSQGIVYALDADIVIKLPLQYIAPENLDNDAIDYLEHALRSFIAMERELAVYHSVADRPHDNIVQRLNVKELVDVISWLEELGFTHGDLAVRNLAVDSSHRLKIFDFGSTTTTDHYDYAADVARDPSGLAICLHFLLTGVEPLANVCSAQEVRQIEGQLLAGRGTISPGAEPLADIIQAGWTRKAAATKFSHVKKRVEAIINVTGQESTPKVPEEHYRRLELRCAEWLEKAVPDRRWMNPNSYCATCRAKDYDVELDIWR